MKLFLTLAVTALSLAAQAMPAVGDTANFSGQTATGSGQLVQFTMSMQLTAFDAASQTWTEQVTTTVPGRPAQVQTKQVATSDLISDATVTQLIANCAGEGGVAETVTVPAGTYPTCRITDNQGAAYNVGQVPFGIVQAAQPSSQLSMQLQSFAAGH